MVCQRCISTIENILKQISIKYDSVVIGEIKLPQEPNSEKLIQLDLQLKNNGFEIIKSQKNKVIEKIKISVDEYIKMIESKNERTLNLSDFIKSKLHYEYSYLSDLYSSIEGETIEHYFIKSRIERAKELIVYNELNLSEISFILGFSSVHHLSSQFKKITGLSPSHFKKIIAFKKQLKS